ncbi:MAG: hypothetical protein K5644_10320 [Lachnospiraceae bacterium]|nr:hypothetical protein [Lachnospiraceae bacterium]
MNKGKLVVRDVALLGIMVAMLEGVKLALSFLPNVELVSFLIIMFTLILGWKTLIGVEVFVLVECMIWGFGLWTLMYIYIWPILVVATMLIRKFKSIWPYVIVSAVFGFIFGALCSIPYIFIGGPYQMFTWWVAGLPYDAIHGVSNGVIMLVLYKPIRLAVDKIKASAR